LLWERKITLEKEMQETLNPNYGQKELEELKKEIHRMELRLDDIRKKQENVIVEMERAVYKRVISVIIFRKQYNLNILKLLIPKKNKVIIN
jgi:hypothetical protein